MLVRHRIRMLHPPHFLDTGKSLRQSLLAVAHHDDALASVPARTPKIVVLMAADRLGQAVFGAKQVDCAGLAVVLAINRRPGLNVRWKRMERARDGGRHFLPSE